MPRLTRLMCTLFAVPLLLIACSGAPSDEAVQAAATVLPAPPTAAGVEYPSDIATAEPQNEPSASYPGPPPTAVPTITVASYPPSEDVVESAVTAEANNALPDASIVYLPFAGGPSAVQAAAPEPESTPEPQPTIDVAALRQELQTQGQELAFVKTGFHVTLPEDRDVLDPWMERLDDAGVPFFLKTVDNAEPLFKAQELMRASGVPHVLVYRASGSVPNYELPPQQAAAAHWAAHRDLFPPELDPDIVWIETLNEPDRTQSEWLAEFATATAQLALADGFRWAAFGWASGEPEPEQWRGPAMQNFLRLAAENPQRLAIAVHEYSYTTEEIGHEYPYKIGRFLELFRVADELGIPRPTVLITEWGWEYADIPAPDEAIKDLKWVSDLYAAYPQVQGAAIWNIGIGCCYGDISEQVQEIVGRVTDLSLTEYFAIPQEPQPVDTARFQP